MGRQIPTKVRPGSSSPLLGNQSPSLQGRAGQQIWKVETPTENTGAVGGNTWRNGGLYPRGRGAAQQGRKEPPCQTSGFQGGKRKRHHVANPGSSHCAHPAKGAGVPGPRRALDGCPGRIPRGLPHGRATTEAATPDHWPGL